MGRRRTEKAQRARSWGVTMAAAAAFATSLLAGSSTASAQQASPKGKGMIGGGLLGGELVMSVEAAFGVRSPWAYLIGGVVGAGGGVAGGYVVEQNADTKYSLLLLAGGMALAIPTTIAVLGATAYSPPADYQEDRAPSGTEPIADVPRPSDPSPLPGSSPAPRGAPAAPAAPAPAAPATPPGPGGLLRTPRRAKKAVVATVSASPRAPSGSMVNLSDGSLHMGVPAVEVRPMFSQQELRQYGVQQQQEVRVPIFHARF